MTQVFFYENADLGNQRVRLGSIASITQSAERGVIGTSTIELDDPLGTLDLPPFFGFLWYEHAASQPLVYVGYGSNRGYVKADSLIVGAARRISLQLEDLNIQLQFRIINHNTPGYKRPAEDDYHRIDWLLANVLTTTQDNGLIDRDPLTNVSMSAVDYTGQTADQILQDCSDLSGKNYFMYPDPTTGDRSLAYFKSDDASFYPSTLSISNVLSDLSSTCYPPLQEPTLDRDPSQVYNGALMDYSGGAIYLQRGTDLPLIRDVVIPSANTSSKTHATALVQKYLAAAALERETVTCTVQLRAADINKLNQGMLVNARFTNFDGWDPGIDVRVLSRSISTEMSDQFYNVQLTLGHPKLVSFASGGVPDNTKVWPSDQPPFHQGTSTGYIPTVINDGAVHAWKYDEASGDVLDYKDSVDGTVTTAGSNPIRQVSGPPLIIGSKAMGFAREDVGGAVTVNAQNDGADWPSGNGDWTWEWWHQWSAPFFGAEYVAKWGTVITHQTIEVISDFGHGLTGPSVFLAGVVSFSDIGAGAGNVPVPGSATDGNWHNYMVAYSGTTRTASVYYDGVLQGAVVAVADLAIVNPSVAGATWLMEFNVLEGFEFGWQSLYSSALTAVQAANHALGDGAVSDTSSPAIGQPVAPESATGDGHTVTYTTNYPYVPGSLIVKVNGSIVAATETDPATGMFTLPAPPTVGALITWTYNVADPTPTGASNPAPPPGGPTVPPDPGSGTGGDGVSRPPQQTYTPAETPDGIITTFTIVPYVPSYTVVYINGLIQRPVIDWNELSPSAGTIEFTTAPWTGAAITVLAMPLVAPGSGSGFGNPSLYGVGLNADTKANIQCGPEGVIFHVFVSVGGILDTVRFAQRGGAVYSGGTGGTINVQVFAANADGTPTGSALASQTYTPGNPGGSWAVFDQVTWSSPATLTAGTRYGIKFTNSNGTPLVNYVSINELYIYPTSPLPPGQGRQPQFADADWAVLVDAGSGFVVRSRYTADMDLGYSGGAHQGMGYVQAFTGQYGSITSTTTMVRELFTVSGGDRTVNTASVRVRRSSGTAPLVLGLYTGADALIEAVSVPASLVPISAAGGDDGGSVWVGVRFLANHVLTDAATYYLRLSCAAGTTYTAMPLRKGTTNSFAGSTVFMDGAGQFTTNSGGTWTNLYTFDTDPPDLQAYFGVVT